MPSDFLRRLRTLEIQEALAGALTLSAGGVQSLRIGADVDLTRGAASLLVGPLAQFTRMGLGAAPDATAVLYATSASPPATIERDSNTLVTTREVLALRIRNLGGEAADGFGGNLTWYMQDQTSGVVQQATIGAVRSGADNSHALAFSTTNAGALTERLRIAPVGVTISTTFFLTGLSGAGAGTALVITGGNEVIPLASRAKYKGAWRSLTPEESSAIYGITPKAWVWNELSSTPGVPDIGFVFEDVEAAAPGLVRGDSINYVGLQAHMLMEMKALNQRIAWLERVLGGLPGHTP